MSKLFKKGKNRVEGEKIIKKYTLHLVVAALVEMAGSVRTQLLSTL